MKPPAVVDLLLMLQFRLYITVSINILYIILLSCYGAAVVNIIIVDILAICGHSKSIEVGRFHVKVGESKNRLLYTKIADD